MNPDVIVIGAGAVGSAAAYHLSLRGASVTLLEQFSLGHDRGSSHGPSRIIRYSYADPLYAGLMGEAFASWRALEADGGETLYFRTGGVSLCPPGLDYVDQVETSLRGLGIPHRRMKADELRRVAPAFEIRDDEQVVFEPDIGILPADRIVKLTWELCNRHGGDRFSFRADAKVERIELENDRPVVCVGEERIKARRVIVTAGAWVSRLVPRLSVPIQVTRQCVFHFRPRDLAPFAIGRFPVFIRKREAGHEAFYGLPDFAGTGVKAALHHVGASVDPDVVEREVTAADESRVRACLEILPALATSPVERKHVCLYTVGPGENFVVGPLPDRPDVIVGSACGGHGFKFSQLVGRVLADYALDGETPLGVSAWLPSARSAGE
jgi:sarcosine oxidase